MNGKDETAPFADHIRINPDNMITLIPVDGGIVKIAMVRIISKEQPDLIIEDHMNDDGVDGSHQGGPCFSKKVEVPDFGSYIVEENMVDEYGNVQVTRAPESSIFYGRKLYHD